MMELNSKNYYSLEADREYMSCSQYQAFLECEAAEMAKLRGDYVPSKSKALIVGNYFHTAFESEEAHTEFCEENADLIYKKVRKKTGEIEMYSDFEKAEKMITAVKNDPLMRTFINMLGENEKILTGELFGMLWKIRLDKYIPDKRIIIDYKTTESILTLSYNAKTGRKDSFIETWDYLMRAAVYSEIEKQNAGSTEDPKFLILAVSKEEPPDKGAFLLNHRQRYDYELEEVKKHLAHIRQVKEGIIRPLRCGRCEYCRSTKVLTKIVPYYTLNPEFADEREEEYDHVMDTSNLAVAQEETVH